MKPPRPIRLVLELAILPIATLILAAMPLKAESDLRELSHSQDWRAYDKMSRNYRSNFVNYCSDLTAIAEDEKSVNVSRSAAMYYLGQMRAVQAVDVLANNITLRFDKSKIPLMSHLENIAMSEYPAVDALINIGNKSIAALIRKLTTSDEAQIRKFSLEALCRIDGDKDIVRLRLQKALLTEGSKASKGRLQTALKALDETSFSK